MNIEILSEKSIFLLPLLLVNKSQVFEDYFINLLKLTFTNRNESKRHQI